MATKFRRNAKGELVAYRDGRKIGKVTTNGDKSRKKSVSRKKGRG